MGDMSQTGDLARRLGELLAEHKGLDVTVLDLRAIGAFTDFFVIATVSSGAHLEGLKRHIREFCAAEGLGIRGGSKRLAPGDEWNLLDLGPIIIHLMSQKMRKFYELERLWSSAEIVYPGVNTQV
jgi:ribosome-associated protein